MYRDLFKILYYFFLDLENTQYYRFFKRLLQKKRLRTFYIIIIIFKIRK